MVACVVTDPKAVCWCAYGAVVRSAMQYGLKPHDVDPLSIALNTLAERRGHPGLVAANDGAGRKAALEILDDAIAELQAGGAA